LAVNSALVSILQRLRLAWCSDVYEVLSEDVISYGKYLTLGCVRLLPVHSATRQPPHRREW
jgi:hypothetical protein